MTVIIPKDETEYLKRRIEKHLRMLGLKTSGERFGQIRDYVLDMYLEGIDRILEAAFEDFQRSEPPSSTEH